MVAWHVADAPVRAAAAVAKFASLAAAFRSAFFASRHTRPRSSVHTAVGVAAFSAVLRGAGAARTCSVWPAGDTATLLFAAASPACRCRAARAVCMPWCEMGGDINVGFGCAFCEEISVVSEAFFGGEMACSF